MDLHSCGDINIWNCIESHSVALKGICLNLYGRSYSCIFPMIDEHSVMKITILLLLAATIWAKFYTVSSSHELACIPPSHECGQIVMRG